MHAYTIARLNDMGQPVAFYAGHEPFEICGVTHPDWGSVPTWTRDIEKAALSDLETASRDADQFTDYEAFKGLCRQYVAYRVEGPQG